jgi:small-conductance mechanosensitive channel
MTPAPENDDNLFRTLIAAGWLLLALLIACGWIFISQRFAAGIACGGLLALGNTFWLKRSIERAMGLEPRQAGRFAVVRYVLRLAVLAGVLYLLIVTVGIDIIGLIAGLSVLVIVIIGFSLYRAARTGG